MLIPSCRIYIAFESYHEGELTGLYQILRRGYRITEFKSDYREFVELENGIKRHFALKRKLKNSG